MLFRIHTRLKASLAAAALACLATTAHAFPGLYAGKAAAKRINHSTHVVVMMKGEDTVVTVMPDYEGPLDEFAMVLPVPADVTLDTVRSVKSDMVEHLDEITAPRFWEFWEKDPCDPSDQIQEWQRDLRVSGVGFLGEGMPIPDEQRKVPKELQLKVEPVFKEGIHSEYGFELVPGSESLSARIGALGYTLPPRAEEAIAKHIARGGQFLLARVDSRRVALAGKRALLSPVRFATREKITLSSTLGLLNLGSKQELFLYVIHPDQRFEVANYPNAFPPTDVHVDFKVKERMGEFYVALHDLLLAKAPTAFLTEYAWDASGCGQPCPNAPLSLSELLSFGGDYFEQSVPEEDRAPKPPELSEDEKKEAKAFLEGIEDKKLRREEEKRIKEDRIELARRKALIARHKYVVTRLHHRYDATTLPNDIELRPAPHVRGGVGVPKGEKGEMARAVETITSRSELQTRYTHLHPNKKVIKCENPERYRWGIAPPEYRGLRKIWVAQNLAERNRTQIKPAEMILTDVPELALSGQWSKLETEQKALEAAAKDARKSKCGCRTIGSTQRGFGGGALGLLGVLLPCWFARRRRYRLPSGQ